MRPAAPFFERSEAAELRRAAFGMQFRREGIAQGPRGLEPEHAEKGFIGIGETAGGIAPEDGVALGIDQAFVANLALIQPGIHGGGIAQRSLKPFGRGAQFAGLARQHAVAFARIQKIGDQEGQRHGQKRAEAGGRNDGQPELLSWYLKIKN